MALSPPPPFKPPLVKAVYRYPKFTKGMKNKALVVVAMRANGSSAEEIQAAIGLAPATQTAYVWQATKLGFLVNKKTGATLHGSLDDELNNDIAAKVVRNLNAVLDGKDAVTLADGTTQPLSDRQTKLTLKVAEGTLFKRYDQKPDGAGPNMNANILQIRIEGGIAGTASVEQPAELVLDGAPLYAEGDVLTDGAE